MATNMPVTVPTAGLPTLGQEQQKTDLYTDLYNVINRQEKVINTAARKLTEFKERLDNKPDRTPEENDQRNAIKSRIGDLDGCREDLRNTLVREIENIVNLDFLLKNLRKITENMQEEAKKIKNAITALEAGTNIVTFANKSIGHLKAQA
jgi:chromosome segregation ATPase